MLDKSFWKSFGQPLLSCALADRANMRLVPRKIDAKTCQFCIVLPGLSGNMMCGPPDQFRQPQTSGIDANDWWTLHHQYPHDSRY